MICPSATALTRPPMIGSTAGARLVIWDRMMDAVVKAHDGQNRMIDSSIVRGHQHASGVNAGWRIRQCYAR